MSVATAGMFPYQLAALGRMGPRCTSLFLPYGAGKSWLSLAYADQQPGEGCVYIFCRKRNIYTWRREINLRDPAAAIAVGRDLVGTTTLPLNPPQYIIIGHPQIAPQQAGIVRLMQLYPPKALIFDESTRIKNPKAQITQAALAISREVDRDVARIILTGNPIPEGCHEVWSQYAFAYPYSNPYGESYYQFLRRWFLKTDYGWSLNFALQPQFQMLLNNGCVYLTPAECAALDEARGVVEQRYVLETYTPSAQQRKLIDELYRTWSLPRLSELSDKQKTSQELLLDGAETTDGTIEYIHALSLLQKAAQISSGFYYGENMEPIYLTQNPKLTLLIEIIKGLLEEVPTRGIIVWSRFLAERKMIAQTLWQAQVSAVLGPDEESLSQFIAPVQGAPSVIIMPAQISEGFNELVRADTAIYYSSPYSAENRSQAEARICRIGQRAPVVTHIDIAGIGMMDMEIALCLQNKTLDRAALVSIVNRHQS